MLNLDEDEVFKNLRKSWAKIDKQLFTEAFSLLNNDLAELLRYGRHWGLKTFTDVSKQYSMAYDYSWASKNMLASVKKFFNEHPEELVRFEQALVNVDAPMPTSHQNISNAPREPQSKIDSIDDKARRIAGNIAKKKGQPITDGLVDWVKKQIELGKFLEEIEH